MKILYDEPKRRRNFEKHGLDFKELTIDFFNAATIYPARQGRMVAVGGLGNSAVTVVFAYLGAEALSIISVRPSSRKERKNR